MSSKPGAGQTGLPREIGELRSLERAVAADEQLGLYLESNFFPDPYPELIGHGQPSSTIKVLSFLRGEFDTAGPDLSTDARVSENVDDPEEGDQDVEEALRQRPAAFGFGIRRGMIDALPEHSEIIDFDVAGDIYAELSSKTQSLSVRLTQMNADPRVQHSANRLLDALGSRLEEIRPGVLLSRARSIEADRNAFDSEEGRRELFPEAIAMMDDVLLSLQDMLATFPIVRRIEAERLALSIQADENILGAISAQMNVIAEGASGSDVVTESAVAALQKNDAAIADARTSDVRAGLVADQLLVHRNFVSETLRLARDYGAKATTAAGENLWKASEELKDLGGKSWQEVKNNPCLSG